MKKRTTDSYTPAPRTPPKKRAHTRGGKREAIATIDLSHGPVELEDSYVPDGSDPDDD